MNYTVEFKTFWKKYPSRWSNSQHCYIKRKKSPAFKSWQKLSQEIRNKCLRIVKRIKKSEGEAVRDCVTWLNQEGWDDIEETSYKPALPPAMIDVLKTVPGPPNLNDERNKQIKELIK